MPDNEARLSWREYVRPAADGGALALIALAGFLVLRGANSLLKEVDESPQDLRALVNIAPNEDISQVCNRYQIDDSLCGKAVLRDGKADLLLRPQDDNPRTHRNRRQSDY